LELSVAIGDLFPDFVQTLHGLCVLLVVCRLGSDDSSGGTEKRKAALSSGLSKRDRGETLWEKTNALREEASSSPSHLQSIDWVPEFERLLNAFVRKWLGICEKYLFESL
jgi:hypothetical protein